MTLKPIFALYDAGDVLLSYGLGFFLVFFLVGFMVWQSIKDPLLFLKKITQCLTEHQDYFRKADSAEMKTISAVLNSMTDYNFEKIRMPLLSAIENLSEYKIELTEQLLIAEVENETRLNPESLYQMTLEIEKNIPLMS